MTYSGVILDAETETPLPGATIALHNKTVVLATAAANSKGEFVFQTTQPATNIVVSHIDFLTMIWPASQYQHRFELEKDYQNEGEVIIVSSSKKKKIWPWLLLVIGIVTLSNKRK